MTDRWTDRLSEYLDDELDDETRQALAVHLAGCSQCQGVLEDLQGVIARAGRLEDREPEAELWPGIKAAIGSGKVVSLESRRGARRFSFTLHQLVAAAAALVLVSGGVAWFIASGSPVSTLAVEPEEPPVPMYQPVLFDRNGRADSAITELEQILESQRESLDTSTVRILSDNLSLIDRAIGQARKALESDPNNPYLNDHLARTMRKKIEVLRRAADLAQAAS
jgi:hypothetical protein